MISIDEQLKDIHDHNVKQDERAQGLADRVSMLEGIVHTLFPVSAEALKKDLASKERDVRVPPTPGAPYGIRP